LDDLFYKYGKIKDIAIPRSERGPAFAFVEYYDARDADDAVYYRRDYKFDGARLKVELSKRRPDRNDRGERGGRDGRERNPREDRERRAPNRSEFGLIIKNIDNRCSWQTLKDHMRGEGKSQFKVTFSNMDKSNGIGEVEYETQEDMEDALKALDGTSLERYPDDKLEISARPAQEKAPERESESAAVEMDAPKEQDNENVDAEKQERGASED
jgi:arginine/serine-rich splicing factor 1/9